MHLPRSDVGSGRLVYPRQAPGGGFGGGPPGFGGGFRGGFGRGGKGHGFPPFGGAGAGAGGAGATGGSSAATNVCPQTNGTTIGSVQSFTLLCDTAVGGDVINSTTVDSFDACTVACASFHPKCEAVSFDGTTCSLKANLANTGSGAATAAASTTLNGGIAQFPAASSNCGTLGASVTQSNMNFNLFCNNVIDGADITQNNAATLQDCMDQCATTSGCGAVSFDASYTQGFKNCYLKTAGGPAPIVDTGIDTAVMGNAVVAADSSSAVTSAAPATTAVSSAAAVSSTTNAGVITVAPPQPSIVTQTVVSVVTSISDSVSRTMVTTEVITVPMLSGSTLAGGGLYTGTATGTTAAATSAMSMAGMASSTATAAAASLVSTTDGGGNSRAWIAAPVVGSVAAVMVVAVMFVLWGRRRRNNGLSSPLSPAFLFNRFRGGGGGDRDRGGNGGTSGFRNLSSADSNSQSFSRPQVPFGNSWRTSGKDVEKDDTMTTAIGNNNMSEKYGAGSGVARKITIDEESGSSSRTGTGHGKSVPLVIDTGLARSSSSKSSKSKPNIVAVAVTTDAAERAVRDKGKEASKEIGAASSTGSSSSSEKPVPTRDLTANSSGQTDAKGKVALRDSLNGLAQNRTTLDGIPIFLRE